MYKLAVFIILCTFLSCKKSSQKDFIKSNKDILHINVENYIKSSMNNPDSFDFVSMKIDSIYYLKSELQMYNYIKKSIEENLSPEGILKREDDKRKRLKYLNEENKKRYLKRYRSTETLKQEYTAALKKIDSLTNALEMDNDFITRYDITIIYRQSNLYNAIVLDTSKLNADKNLRVFY